MTTAIQVSDVTKVYQRYSHRKQFRTLKSALLGGSLLSDLRPDERFPALSGVTFNVRAGSTPNPCPRRLENVRAGVPLDPARPRRNLSAP